MEAIFNAIRYKPKFVLDADIAKCFDRINYEAPIEKLNILPAHIIFVYFLCLIKSNGRYRNNP
jgi:retron-type reverse transcriptase